MIELQGNCTILLDSAEVLITFCRSLCFSAFFLAPLFFFGIFTCGTGRHSLFQFFGYFEYLDTPTMAAPSPSVHVDSESPQVAPEEAMDVQSTKFEDGVWYRKYQLLKRKCSEFEQVNNGCTIGPSCLCQKFDNHTCGHVDL